jgi:hypothetical protein
MTWTVMVFGGQEQPPLNRLAPWKPGSSISDMRMRISACWEPVVLGAYDEVQQRISAHLPGIEWLAPTCGSYSHEGLHFTFDLRSEGLVTYFAVDVQGRGDALAGLLQFAVPNCWHLLDGWTGEFINADSPSGAGWVACQQYWDEVSRFFHSVVPLRGKGRLF